MLGQLIAITRNTFLESIRQPIMLVLLVVATIGLVFSNLLAGFTMEDDQRMMIDLGLSTVFICGALLAAFIATNVLNREIENRTALTVISKPVARPIFVAGKFFGVAGALLTATIYMCFVFQLVAMHGVLQTVRDPVHVPVLIFGVGAALLGLGAGIWCNYFYGKVFASSVIVITTPLAGLAYLLSLMFDHDFGRQPIGTAFNGQIWIALAALGMGILVLAAIAIAASTRLRQVMTLCVTVGVFFVGMGSDWFFARHLRDLDAAWMERARAAGLTETVKDTRTIELVGGAVEQWTVDKDVAKVPLSSMAGGAGEHVEHFLYRAGYSILPNFQAFWLSDAVTQGHVIRLRLLGDIVLYGLLYIVGVLAVAVILFQRREVG